MEQINEILQQIQLFAQQLTSDDLIRLTAATTFLSLLIAWSALRKAARLERQVHENKPDAKNPLGGMIGRLERQKMAYEHLSSEFAKTTRELKKEISLLKGEKELGASVESITAKSPSVEPVLEPVAEKKNLESTKVPEQVVEDPASVSTEALVEKPVEPKSSTAKEIVTDDSAETAEPLSQKLTKTRSGLFGKLKGLFFGKALSVDALEEAEALLVSSDIGIKAVQSLIEEVKAEIESGKDVSQDHFFSMLKNRVETILKTDAPSTDIDISKRADGPTVVMMVGVNGVGKTTTSGKLAKQWKDQGKKVLLVAADTFRAAAVEQLAMWADKVGVDVLKGEPEAKPATVVYQAMEKAIKESYDVVLIDTAGRLHTKSNLMSELEGVKNSIQKHMSSAPHETILVVDGSTGQNAINQAREFNQAVTLTGLVVTKLDGTPKGGVVVAIKQEIGIPVRYIGVGESAVDLRPFIANEFVEALFTDTDGVSSQVEQGAVSAHAETRRRRRRRDAVG